MPFARRRAVVIKPSKKRLFYERAVPMYRMVWAWFVVVAAILAFAFLWPMAMAYVSGSLDSRIETRGSQ